MFALCDSGAQASQRGWRKLPLAINFARCEKTGVRKQLPSEPTELAKVLVDRANVSPSYASELANKRKVPSLKMAVRLEQRIGIPPRFWIERLEAAA